MYLRKHVAVAAAALVIGVAAPASAAVSHSAESSSHPKPTVLSSLCGAYASGGNGAISDCRPDQAQYTHRIILQCTNLEGGLYEKAGPWVGGYSVSKATCNRSWDSRHRYWSEGYPESS